MYVNEIEHASIVPITFTKSIDEPCVEGFEFIASTSDLAMNEVLVNDLEFDAYEPTIADLVELHTWLYAEAA